MRVRPLYSSSSGNACKVASDNTLLLIEAGVSYKKLVEANGTDIFPDAVFITHSHGDHINGAGVLGRKTGAPLYMLREAFKKKEKLFTDCDVRFIAHGDKIVVGDFEVNVFDTRHDRPSVGFVITETTTGKKFGYVTDTGAIGKVVKQSISECDAYLLETDYDEEELEKTAEYDDVLKERIRSPFGHLGTQQTLDYVKENINLEKVSWILFGHISTITNSPDLVKARLKNSIDIKYQNKFYLAPQDNELIL
jgi:phosphoribosyl 1,2-cyclic phosphodiesterase